MKFKKYLFWILFFVDMLFLILFQIFYFPSANETSLNNKFIKDFDTLASQTNFTDGQKEKIIKELSNRISWSEPKRNYDNVAIVLLILIISFPISIHIILFIILIINNIKHKNIICPIILNLLSLILLVPSIILIVDYFNDMKPFNLTEKDYTTDNEEFNKLIKDKINSINWKAYKKETSSVFLSLSIIITIVVLLIIIIDKIIEKIKENKDNNIPNAEVPLISQM